MCIRDRPKSLCLCPESSEQIDELGKVKLVGSEDDVTVIFLNENMEVPLNANDYMTLYDNKAEVKIEFEIDFIADNLNATRSSSIIVTHDSCIPNNEITAAQAADNSCLYKLLEEFQFPELELEFDPYDLLLKLELPTKGTFVFPIQEEVLVSNNPQWMPLGDSFKKINIDNICLLYTSPSPRDLSTSRMPSSA